MSQWRENKTAFVLAGGGSLGAVQVGMLAALAHHGVVPDLVVGVSVGAINAAYYAAEPDNLGSRASSASGVSYAELMFFHSRRSSASSASLGRPIIWLVPHRCDR